MCSNAIKFIFKTVLVLLLSGCAAGRAYLPDDIPPMHTVSEFSDDENVSRTRDPWEGFNRSMYKFNYEADRFVLLPVVAGYETAVPRVARTGVSNFFANLREVRTFYNCILQAKGKKSLVTLGRFLTNSTIGIGGLFDPATAFGWRREHEDFDRTLETWGVGTGPYWFCRSSARTRSGAQADLRSTVASAGRSRTLSIRLAGPEPAPRSRRGSPLWKRWICATGKVSAITIATIRLNTTWSDTSSARSES